ncbi:unnamed protein product, partial [Polarella glacialis]
MTAIEPHSEQSRHHQPSLLHWRGKVKDALKLAGGQSSSAALLFGDADLGDDALCADIYSLLSTGAIPQMWASEERATVMEIVQEVERAEAKGKEEELAHGLDSEEEEEEEDGDIAKEEGHSEWLAAHTKFADRCHHRLHIILCMSPLGDLVRTRLRQFPALARRCVIDWYADYPASALHAVAQRCLMKLELDEKFIPVCSQMCEHMQSSVVLEAGVTWPGRCHSSFMSYLELLGVFMRMLVSTREQVKRQETKFSEGLEGVKILSEALASLRGKSSSMEPELESRIEQIRQIDSDILAQEGAVEEARAALLAEEVAAHEPFTRAAAIKAECEAELATIDNAMGEAQTMLDHLTTQELAEVRNMRNPSNTIKKVLEIVCIMKGQRTVRVRDDSSSSVAAHTDSWPASQKVLQDPSFLQWIQKFDKEHVSISIVKMVTKMLADEDVEAPKVLRSSKAVYSLYCWVQAVIQYDQISKAVKPKRQALAAAEAERAEINARREAREEELQ